MATLSVNVSSSGNNTLVAGIVGTQIVVTGWSLQTASGTVNVAFQDSLGNSFMAPVALFNVPDANSDLAGAAGGFQQWEVSQSDEIFSCGDGAALILNLSGAVNVTGTVDYYLRASAMSGTNDF